MPGREQALRRLSRLPEGPAGRPPRRADGDGPGAQERLGRRTARGDGGRQRPAQRGAAEGLHFPRLLPAGRQGPECAPEGSGGRARPRGVSLLRSQQRGASAHHPQPDGGVEAVSPAGDGGGGRPGPAAVRAHLRRQGARAGGLLRGAGEQQNFPGGAEGASLRYAGSVGLRSGGGLYGPGGPPGGTACRPWQV